MASVDARKLKDSAAEYLKKSKFEKAAEVLEQLVQAEPKDMQHRFRLGDCYRKLAQPQKSIAQYDAAGRYYADQGQLIKGIAAVKVILEIDPRNAEAQKQLAEMNERRLGKVTLESAGLAGGKRAAIGRIAAAKAVPDGGAGQAEAIELPEEPQITKRVAPAATRGAQRGAMADRIQIDAGADDADLLELDDSPKSFSPGYSQDALIMPPPEAHSGSPAGHLEIQDLPDDAILEADPEDLAASPDDEEVVALSLEPGRPIADLLGSDAEEEIELLATLEEGAFFGEMALLSGAPRTANVSAEDDTELLEVSDAVLRHLARNHPQVVKSLKNFYRQRLLNNVMAISPLFKDFDPAERKSIVEKFRMKQATPGEALINEGKNSDGLYVVLHGSVQVSKRDRHPIELARLKEGDVFGEMSLLTRQPATATVTAQSNSILLRLPRENFQELVLTHPQILELVAELTEQRKSATEAILQGQGAGHDGMSFV